MAFLAICTALYDYVPQGEGELPIREGELLYILEKSADDDWWKAKKKADGENDEEPVGLIPNNYVEEVGGAVLDDRESRTGQAAQSLESMGGSDSGRC